MPSPSFSNIRERRVAYARELVLWTCAFSLLIVLASRVPCFPRAGDTAWVRSVPPQSTAKLLVRDLYVLPLVGPGAAAPVHLVPTRFHAKESEPVFRVFLDSCLYTRPPPSA